MARWQSGYAADCKSVYAGSIPARASIFSLSCAAIRSRSKPMTTLDARAGMTFY